MVPLNDQRFTHPCRKDTDELTDAQLFDSVGL